MNYVQILDMELFQALPNLVKLYTRLSSRLDVCFKDHGLPPPFNPPPQVVTGNTARFIQFDKDKMP